jgi:hypothetical protein
LQPALKTTIAASAVLSRTWTGTRGQDEGFRENLAGIFKPCSHFENASVARPGKYRKSFPEHRAIFSFGFRKGLLSKVLKSRATAFITIFFGRCSGNNLT